MLSTVFVIFVNDLLTYINDVDLSVNVGDRTYSSTLMTQFYSFMIGCLGV